MRKSYFGIVFQSDYLYDNLTVEENLKVSNYINDELKEFDSDILSNMDICHLINKKVKELSGGEKQRVNIARALQKKCEVLIVDEPTSSLDEENSRIIFDLLKEISKQKLVILVSHDKDELISISDLFVELSYGKIKQIIDKTKDYKEEKIVIAKRKLSLKPFFKLFRLINKGNVFRRLFHFLFFALSLILVLLSSSISSLKQENYIYDYLKDNNVEKYLVIDNNRTLDLSFLDTIDGKYYQLKKHLTLEDFGIYGIDDVKYGNSFLETLQFKIYQKKYTNYRFYCFDVKET